MSVPRRLLASLSALLALAAVLAGPPLLGPQVLQGADPAAPGVGAGSAQGPAGEFRKAEGTRQWTFPRDHGQHPAYRLEWWYYTGIVATPQGRRFGYQVTFFRQGLAGAQPHRSSAWAVRSLYLAHAAVSDIAARRYHRASRAGRDSLGMSGAAAQRHEVWLSTWRASPLPDDPHGVKIHVAAEDFTLALTLRAQKEPVLHGNQGLDRKGPERGQASWYYSQPRMVTEGTLTLGGKRHEVRGTTWMDHEFGTSQLAEGLVGWDWLALRLDDGSDLMLYRLRRRDGTADTHSSGSLVAPDGTRTELALTGNGNGRAGMTPGRVWHSPHTQGAYPLEWQVRLPGEGLELRVVPEFDDQEQRPTVGTTFAYWEGAVRARGTRMGRPVRAEGYLELTGYAGELGGALR
ncbi:MAG: carotenoid 1,2-hydratase [SAR324 cluster bacterium]|nr:carotenoid 1,2-hydratase [SAR324 cluster bacterium]